MSELKEKILNKIKEGKLKMKPRFYFILKFTGMILAIIILIIAVLFLISFVIFSLRLRGILYLPHFGPRGVGLFFLSLPRLLILIILIILLILELFVKKLAPIYRKPLIYSLLILIIIMVFSGIIIEQTAIHYRFLRSGSLYQHVLPPSPLHNVWRGVIEEILSNKLIIKDLIDNKNKYTVQITPLTKILSRTNLKVGDSVVIIGQKIGDIINAEQIRSFNDYFYHK